MAKKEKEEIVLISISINYKNKKNEQDKRDAFLLATKIMNK